MLKVNENAQGSANRQLEVLRHLSAELAQAADIDAVLWTIARSTMQTLGYEDCVIYVASPDRNALIQRAAHGPKCPEGEEVINPIVLQVGTGIVGTCAALGAPVRVADTSADDRYVVDDQVRGSELAVPVIDNGEVIAVIDSEHSEVDFYTIEDEQALIDIAALAASRLQTAMTMEALHESVNQLEAARQELASIASSDHLTSLLNRRGFEDAMSVLDNEHGELCVALLDIDRFKAINDTYGHRCGDEVLCDLAMILIETVEATEIVVARLGGDEFALLGPDVSSVSRSALAVLSAVRERQWEHGHARLDVSVSIGASSTNHGDVWGYADEALFLAKAQGRDQLVVYDPDDPRLIELRSDRQWAAVVRQAMDDDDLVLFGQPIVHSNRIDAPPAYYEMLLRYRSPEGSIVSPARLLGAAERFGLSEQLDLWVTQKVIEWLAGQPDDIHATVNVTAHFVDSSRALGHLANMLQECRVKPSRLCIEITESTAIADMERCKEFVRTAHRWGCKIAIDDFGNGWTALPLVRDLDVDVLKIDGSWVKNVTSDNLSCSVVVAIVEAARIIGVDVVAEWVEDEATVKFLQELGVQYLQGFLTGVPAPLPPASITPASPAVAASQALKAQSPFAQGGHSVRS